VDPRFSVVLDADPGPETVAALGAQRTAPHQVLTWGGDASFEHIVRSCDGDVIVFCTAGDVWHPQRLFRTARAFRLEPELGLAFCDAHVRGSRNSLWEATGFRAFEKNSAVTGNLLPVLIRGADVALGTISMRADLRDLVLPIPDDVSTSAWIMFCAALVRPYKVQTEPLLESPLRPAEQHDRARLAEAVVERYERLGNSYLAEHALGPQPLTARALNDLRQLAHHLRVRESLPPRGAKRTRILIDELRRRNYHRYGAGVRGFLRDLVSG
jgi:hypothetical protein